jgi:tetratricopeptide (TPR) repeat protein
LAVVHTNTSELQIAEKFYAKALIEFQAIGNHRLTAIANNNLGVLFLLMRRFDEARLRLSAAREVFIHLGDRIRCAQVDDSLAWLYMAQENLSEAQLAIDRSIRTMQVGDEDALLAESLATQGMIYCKLKRYHEAQQVLEAAYRLSSRCGDVQGAARAVLIIAEEMREILNSGDLYHIRARLIDALSHSPQPSVQTRIEQCLTLLHGMD